MRPLDLKEFAEDMRRKGDIRNTDLADEILTLIDIEQEVAEPYSTLCCDIERYAKDGGYPNPDDALKSVEWLGDRSNLLFDIERQLKEADKSGNADDVIKGLLGTLAEAEDILEAAGWPGTDFINALENLAKNVPQQEYDL